MKVNEYLFQILTSKFRFDLMHWNVSIGPDKWHVSIGPEKWPIFGHFLTLFPLKQHEKNTSNMAATVGDVMDNVHVLYRKGKENKVVHTCT
jgi:hypothetical protein